MYLSEIIYLGERRMFFVKYFLASAGILIFWIILRKSGIRLKAKSIMIYNGVILAIICTETYCFYFLPNQYIELKYKTALDYGVKYDKRTKYEVYIALKEKYLNVVPSFRPIEIIERDEYKSTALLPLSGISNKLTLGPNENGQHMIYQSDRYGFNNPDYLWDSDIEWLILGDSFAQGVAVKQKENIAGNIFAMTKEAVINLGMSGNGPLLALASLMEYGPTVKPKNVLWFYYEGNDLNYDLEKEMKHKILLKYLNEDYSQELINKQLELNNLLSHHVQHKIYELKSTKKDYYKILNFQNVRRLMKIDKKEKVKHRHINSLPLFYCVLNKAKNIVNSWGGNLYFIYLPEYGRYYKINNDHNAYLRRTELISSISNNLEISVIDIHKEVFERIEYPLSLFPFRLPGHYNPVGYKNISEAVLRGIKTKRNIDNYNKITAD